MNLLARHTVTLENCLLWLAAYWHPYRAYSDREPQQWKSSLDRIVTKCNEHNRWYVSIVGYTGHRWSGCHDFPR